MRKKKPIHLTFFSYEYLWSKHDVRTLASAEPRVPLFQSLWESKQTRHPGQGQKLELFLCLRKKKKWLEKERQEGLLYHFFSRIKAYY